MRVVNFLHIPIVIFLFSCESNKELKEVTENDDDLAQIDSLRISKQETDFTVKTRTLNSVKVLKRGIKAYREYFLKSHTDTVVLEDYGQYEEDNKEVVNYTVISYPDSFYIIPFDSSITSKVNILMLDNYFHKDTLLEFTKFFSIDSFDIIQAKSFHNPYSNLPSNFIQSDHVFIFLQDSLIDVGSATHYESCEYNSIDIVGVVQNDTANFILVEDSYNSVSLQQLNSKLNGVHYVNNNYDPASDFMR